MNTLILFPNRYKMIGWVMLIAAIVMAIVTMIMGTDIHALNGKVLAILGSDAEHPVAWFSLVRVNLTYTLNSVLFIAGGILVAFSAEKEEDEYTGQVRLKALQWATFINYTLLLLLFATVYGPDFLVVVAYSVYTTIVLFIICFHYLMSRKPKTITP